jgi:hypothetical protein
MALFENVLSKHFMFIVGAYSLWQVCCCHFSLNSKDIVLQSQKLRRLRLVLVPVLRLLLLLLYLLFVLVSLLLVAKRAMMYG